MPEPGCQLASQSRGGICLTISHILLGNAGMLSHLPRVRAIIAGYGFLGKRIASALLGSGYSIIALRRSPPDDATGIVFAQCDLTKERQEFSDKKFSIAVFCLAPGLRNLEHYESTYCGAQRNFLASVDADQYIYISTTGVYPADSGRYDEFAARPHSERAAILLDAESVALGHPRSVILRLAGLYNKERPIYNAKAVKYSEDKLIHFIHVDDAARAVAHAVQQGLTGIYNVHDGNPLWRSEILQTVRDKTRDKSIAFQRIIENNKFFATGFTPTFPDYFSGIGKV